MVLTIPNYRKLLLPSPLYPRAPAPLTTLFPRFPIPNSRFPIPDSRFPIPDSLGVAI
ncbi:MAG: hypothetical protein F6J94_08490 [Moorea sp. SIO1F2]|uniref:hypothetical protein n=1 Tax=unclassified Moorena TaxID=2683338 RepID=UPI0013BBC9D2|nr:MULTISPECIES: hypothetical protein [unclassified Moorena]NEN96458.1 hypothetical protein [Moorena sp. SIO3I7]NEO07932.1 hypothetical protein [Moorena sp. SIO3I8]NET81976.1 hypothetical protein [Moorena sp. SIO1F2]